MAETSAVPDSPLKSNILEMRRCLLLAVTGSTAEVVPRSPTLKSILEAGFLVQVKTWLDDILAGSVGEIRFFNYSLYLCYLSMPLLNMLIFLSTGGMDLLLHLLTNVAPLPVTKEIVTTSRLGKAVVAVAKHSVCVGSPNEKAIQSRVQNVKAKWSEAVKALKNVS